MERRGSVSAVQTAATSDVLDRGEVLDAEEPLLVGDSALVIAKLSGLQETVDLALAEIRKDLGGLTSLLKETVDRLPLVAPAVQRDAPPAQQNEAARLPTLVFQRSQSGTPTETQNSHDERLVATSLPPFWPASVVQRRISGTRRKRSPRRKMEHGVTTLDNSVATAIAPYFDTRRSTGSSSSAAARSCCFCAMDPHSSFHKLWSILTLTILSYDLIFTPYLLAWNIPLRGFQEAVAWVSIAFWAADLFVSAATSYHVGDKLERRPVHVLLHYARTWFILDVVMVACDCITVMFYPEGNHTLQLVPIARGGKLLRLTCFIRMAKLNHIFYEFVERCFSESFRVTMRWMLIFSGTLWLNHLISCGWFAIGRLAPSDTGLRWVDTAREVNGEVVAFLDSSALYQYITSMHWSMAQFTLGAIDYPCSNSIERMFNITCLILGLVFSSALVSLLSANMVDYQMRRLDETQKLVKLRRFLRQNRVSKATAVLVQRQATQRLSHQEKIKEGDVEALMQISASLRTELRFELFLPHLNAHPLFRVWVTMDATVVRRICGEVLDYAFYRAQDDLFTAGTTTDKAYYLAVGHLDYIQEPETFPVEGIETSVVGEGSWLSEASLWSNWIHVGTAKARTNCEVLVVPCDVVALVLQRNGDISEITQVYLEQYHRRITTAKPPVAVWPSDLQVALTDFGHMVMSMEPELQKAIGLSAIEHVRVTGWHIGRTQPNFTKLRQEISAGKSSVMLDGAGQVERVVSVVVLRLHGNEDRVLVEIGKSEEEDEGRLKPSCQLPGAKQEMGEMASDTLYKLFLRLGLTDDTVTVVQTERTVQWKQSREFGLRTKYLRTEHSALLRADDISLPPLKDVSITRPLWHSRSGGRRHSIGVAKRQSSVDDTLGEDLAEAQAYSFRVGSKRTVYAWLTQSRFDHLGSAAGKRELAAWVETLSAMDDGEESKTLRVDLEQDAEDRREQYNSTEYDEEDIKLSGSLALIETNSIRSI